jgi:hypothetical protein
VEDEGVRFDPLQALWNFELGKQDNRQRAAWMVAPDQVAVRQLVHAIQDDHGTQFLDEGLKEGFLDQSACDFIHILPADSCRMSRLARVRNVRPALASSSPIERNRAGTHRMAAGLRGGRLTPPVVSHGLLAGIVGHFLHVFA